MRVSGISAGWWLGLAAIVSASCTEQLPPYEDPERVLQATVTTRYVFHQLENDVAVMLIVVNAYDETLEAKAILLGQVEIGLVRDADVRKTLPIGSANLVYARGYAPSTGLLRLDPGDSLVFRATWDLVDDRGWDLRQTHFRYIPDPVCSTLRSIALEEVFTVKGTIRVFEKVPAVESGPVLFSFCHVSGWVHPQLCVTILPEEACRFLPR